MTGASGAWQRRRGEQERAWVRELVREGLEERFRAQPGVAERQAQLEDETWSREGCRRQRRRRSCSNCSVGGAA